MGMTMERRLDDELAFHADRLLGLGGSDATTVMDWYEKRNPGLGFKTPWRLWALKRGLIAPEPPGLVTGRGQNVEPQARADYERVVGGLMFPCRMVHPEHAWMRANLDGLSPDATTFLEIKVVRREDHEVAQRGQVPPKYYAQVMHYFAVTQAKVCHYWSFSWVEGVSKPGALVVVYPDLPYIGKLIAAERAFWRLVETDTPPEMTDRDVIERHDAEWAKAARALLESEAILAEWTEKHKANREWVIKLAGSLARVRGAGILATRFVTKGAVDYGAIPVLKGIDLEQYRKPSREQWRIAPEKIAGVE